MDIQEFRDVVRAEFGAHLEYATPEHMRRFLHRMNTQMGSYDRGRTSFAIPTTESAKNYEQVVTDFFARALDMPPEQAMVLLWLFATEMFFSKLGEQYAQELSTLLTFEIPE